MLFAFQECAVMATVGVEILCWFWVGECIGKGSLGMISHKMSLITIFGHKHFRQKFDIFHEKISTASDFVS